MVGLLLVWYTSTVIPSTMILLMLKHNESSLEYKVDFVLVLIITF